MAVLFHTIRPPFSYFQYSRWQTGSTCQDSPSQARCPALQTGGTVQTLSFHLSRRFLRSCNNSQDSACTPHLQGQLPFEKAQLRYVCFPEHLFRVHKQVQASKAPAHYSDPRISAPSSKLLHNLCQYLPDPVSRQYSSIPLLRSPVLRHRPLLPSDRRPPFPYRSLRAFPHLHLLHLLPFPSILLLYSDLLPFQIPWHRTFQD